MLNPLTTPPILNKGHRHRCVSTPIMSRYQTHTEEQAVGKSRSRFSEYEDNIIREGVAQGLTWGQISELLPHRKRATCFNRYRTLQGIRKSRKSSTIEAPQQDEIIYQTSANLSFSSPVSEINSETSSSSSDDESSYSPPPMTTTAHRTHRISLPLSNTASLHRHHSAFHEL